MKSLIVSLLGAAVIPVMSGCISNPTPLSTVGPNPALRTASGANGYLEVFTATETQAGELTTSDYHGYFHPHSSYDVNDEAGKTVKYVPNSTGIMDEIPDRVKLPAGNYQIVAQSTSCGLVQVRVVIEAGKTTAVHLDGNWQRSSKLSSTQLVNLPNGETVGWSGSAMKSSN